MPGHDVRMLGREIVGRRRWQWPVELRSLAAVAVLGVWLLARVLVAATTSRAPVGPRSAVAGGVCQVLAWGLLVAVVGVAAAALTGRPAAGRLSGLVVIVFAGWQHRLPSWCAPSLIDRFLTMPPAGEARPWDDGWSPAAATGWTVTWVLADLAAVLVVAALARPHLGAPFHPRPTRTVRGYVVAAAATVTVVVAMTAMLSGLATDGPATLGAAASFVTADAVVLGAAFLVGVLALGRYPGRRPAVALFAAVALDACAGWLADGNAWSGPQRLGLLPTADWGQWESPTMLLALAAVTFASCAALAAVAPLARALERLQGCPGTALALQVPLTDVATRSFPLLMSTLHA